MSRALKLFYVDNSDYGFSYKYFLARVSTIFKFLNVPFDVTLSEPEFSKFKELSELIANKQFKHNPSSLQLYGMKKAQRIARRSSFAKATADKENSL